MDSSDSYGRSLYNKPVLNETDAYHPFCSEK